MKSILNHENQDHVNRQSLSARNMVRHPSHQTSQQPYKPTIKVGYQQEAPPLNNRNPSQTTRRYKKPVMIVKPPLREQQGLKRVPTHQHQISSGAFVDSEYVVRGKENLRQQFHKKGVNQMREKIYGGKEVDREMKQQFMMRSKSAYLRHAESKPVIDRRGWPHSKSFMKEILEYRNAGAYKDGSLAEKCTNQRATSRCLKFQDLHEYDFRKSKPLIR